MIDESTPSGADITTVLPAEAVLIGSFKWDLLENRWTWSDELFAMHGFEPGEVVPSQQLVLAHKHPEDRDRAARVMDTALRDGGRFSCYHRIIDTREKVHHVLTIGTCQTSPAGGVVTMNGYMADLTNARRADLEPSIQDAIGGVLEHRAVIEQAKGILMAGYGLTPDAAFALLMSTSQATNLKVHLIAARLASRLSRSDAGPLGPDQLDDALARIADE